MIVSPDDCLEHRADWYSAGLGAVGGGGQAQRRDDVICVSSRVRRRCRMDIGKVAGGGVTAGGAAVCP